MEGTKMVSKEIWDEIQRVYENLDPDGGHWDGGLHVPANCVNVDGKVYLSHRRKLKRSEKT